MSFQTAQRGSLLGDESLGRCVFLESCRERVGCDLGKWEESISKIYGVACRGVEPPSPKRLTEKYVANMFGTEIRGMVICLFRNRSIWSLGKKKKKESISWQRRLPSHTLQ